MNRTAVRVGAALSAVVGLAAGCGADPGVARATYAQAVCTAIATFEASLASASATLQTQSGTRTQNLATTRAQVLALLARESTASNGLATALRGVGRPKGSDGPAIARSFTVAAQTVQSVFTNQSRAVADVASSDPAAFYAALTMTSAQLGDADADLVDALEQVADTGDAALNAAFAANNTCSAL